MHTNRRNFLACCAFTREPSDKPPSGAQRHRVRLSHRATQAALGTFLGMPVNCDNSLKQHRQSNAVGVVLDVWLDNSNQLMLSGVLWPKLCPALIEELEKRELGMSYELCRAQVEDFGTDIWHLTDFHFTGVAILEKEKAAYHKSWVKLV